MKIAMPIWQERISPVMDAATRVLVVEYDGAGEISRVEKPLGDEFIPQRARYLAGLGVKVLICGGISQPLLALIAAQGITVIHGITGQAEQILEAYHCNCLHQQKFMMPGCGRRRRGRGFGRGQGRGQGMGQGQRQGRMQGRGRGRKGMNRDREVF